MRRRWILAGLGGVAALAALAAPGARADSGQAKVGDAAEAWYTELPVAPCSSPIGCPPLSSPVSSPYPANTLHVAVSLGQATATTYVQPDLSALPGGQTPISGTMTLPLATVTGNGSANVTAATIEACLLTAPFVDGTAGSTNAPPPTDCSIRAPLAVGATAFHLDLGPFLQAWAKGLPEYGIGLVPAKASSNPVPTWHVAFAGQNLAGSAHITSVVGFGPSSPAAPPAVSAGAVAPPTTIPAPPNPAAISTSPIPLATRPVEAPATTAPPAAPSLAAPTRTGAAPAGAVTVAASKGFQYPEVMLLPLAFAGGMIFAVRLLTSDATPARYKRKSA